MPVSNRRSNPTYTRLFLSISSGIYIDVFRAGLYILYKPAERLALGRETSREHRRALETVPILETEFRRLHNKTIRDPGGKGPMSISWIAHHAWGMRVGSFSRVPSVLQPSRCEQKPQKTIEPLVGKERE